MVMGRPPELGPAPKQVSVWVSDRTVLYLDGKVEAPGEDENDLRGGRLIAAMLPSDMLRALDKTQTLEGRSTRVRKAILAWQGPLPKARTRSARLRAMVARWLEEQPGEGKRVQVQVKVPAEALGGSPDVLHTLTLRITDREYRRLLLRPGATIEDRVLSAVQAWDGDLPQAQTRSEQVVVMVRAWIEATSPEWS